MAGNVDAPVHAARAANGDDELRLSLLDVLRHEEIEHGVELFLKLLRHGPLADVFGDLRNSAALPAQFLDIEGIWQEAHIEHHVGIQGHAELEAEGQDIDAHLVSIFTAKEPPDLFFEIDFPQLRRVDDVRRLVAHGFQAAALLLDAVGDACVRRHRMAAARFLVAADDRLIRGFHEEHLVGRPRLVHLFEHMHEGVEELAPARVHDEHDAAHMSGRMAAKLGKFRDEHRRQIVHHEIAEVFQKAARLRLTAARKPRHDDKFEILLFRHAVHLCKLIRIP